MLSGIGAAHVAKLKQAAAKLSECLIRVSSVGSGLAEHGLADIPKPLGFFVITDPGSGVLPALTLFGGKLGNIAIFAINAALVRQGRGSSGPDAGGCALLWCLEHGLNLRRDCSVGVFPTELGQFLISEVAVQGRENPTWMHRECPHTDFLAAMVHAQSKQGAR